MNLWRLGRKQLAGKTKRTKPGRRNRIWRSDHALGLEPLESRNLLTVTLAPIAGNDANSAFEVPAGKDLYVPLTGSDPGHTVTYTVSSSNANFSTSVLSGNPTLELTVSGTNNNGVAFSGTLTIQLFENLAPDTVSVIEALANSGFYDGLSFYRIVPDFVIQGGANGSKTVDSFADEFNVGLTFNSPGLLAMANPGTADSNTSEFFITDIDQPTVDNPQYLNFRHTIFGQLTSGFDLYNSIMNAQGTSSSDSTPSTPVTITSARIVTDAQQGVVQISEPNNYTGSSTITVTATSSDGSTATRTFTVGAAPPTATTSTTPLYLAPVNDVSTAANTPVSFQISAHQMNSSDLTFSVTGGDGFRSAAVNVSVQVTDNGDDTATVTLTPASGFSGTIELLAHVDDADFDIHDAQSFKVTVLGNVAISTVTSPINSLNAMSTTITGTGNVGESIAVVATDGTNSTSAYVATVAANGSWSIGGIDVRALADGTITYRATASSNSGDSSQTSITATKDTAAPAIAITTATSPINLAGASSTVASGTGEVGTTVSVTASDGTATTAAVIATVNAGGTWSVSGVDVSSLTDGTITYTATLTDTAGNTAVSTKTATKDTVGPTLAISTVTNPVTLGNVTNVGAGGTGEVGATISVTVTDTVNTTTAHTTTVDTNGNWSLTGIDVSALSDGVIHFVVVASDAAGNTVSSSKAANKGAVIISQVTSPINAANAANTSANGTGEAGITITLVVSDGSQSTAARTTTVAEDGTWSITGIDVSVLADGTLTYTVTGTDSLGNAAQNTKTTVKDTVAPTIAITTVTDPINSTGATNTTAAGTSEAGTNVSVVASDGANTTAAVTGVVAAGGNWSVSGIDVSSLTDGTITYTVTVTDAAGNSTSSTKTATKDTLAPAVAIVSATNPINIANSNSVTASGTGEVGASISVVVTDSASNSTTAVTATVGEAGTWTVSGINIGVLRDGSIIYTVTATDAASNTAQATLSAVKSTVSINVVTSPINAANANGASVAGTGQAGATVSVVVTDGTHSTTAYTATIDQSGSWVIDDIDVTSLADGTLTFNVTATDSASNSAQTSKTTLKDTTAPTIAVTSVTTPITTANAASTSISGTGEAGASISVVATDGTHSTTAATATVASDGTWTIASIDVSALSDGTITYQVTSNDTVGNGASTSATATKSSAATASLAGTVYIDSNSSSTHDSGEALLSGIILTLNGTDAQGNPLPTRTTTTGSDGTYLFANLPAGTYSITQSQPTSLTDGSSIAGTLGGTIAANIISGIVLAGGEAGSGYDFNEQGLVSSMLSMRLFMTSTLASTESKSSFFNGYVSDYGTTAPVVMSIEKLDADPPTLDVVRFLVTFNESVTGIDASDFAILGDQSATIDSVEGSATTYTITVFIGDSSGSVGLKLVDDDSIISSDGALLAGAGAGNGTFIGPSYTIAASTSSVAISAVTSPINAANEDSVVASGTGEVGASISLIASNGTNSTTNYSATVASDGTWSISGIDVSSLADGTITFTVTATNTLGKTATATRTATKDTVAPSVAVTTVTDPINGQNSTSVTASGTGEIGGAISLVISDGTNHSTTYTATVASDGTWTISGIDVSSLTDGALVFTATATDAAGNTAQATKSATKDTIAPTVALVEATTPLTIANHKAVVASGTGEAGATITLVVTDGTHLTTTYTGTVGQDGNWSITGIDTSALADGTVTYTATATDAAGNTASSSRTATKTTVAITSVTTPINAENANTVSIHGTGEVGATITLMVSDGTNALSTLTTTIGDDGTWSISEIDTSTLGDGTLTFSVTAADESENTATASITATKDTVAPAGAITNATSPINAANAASVGVQGTGEVGASVTLIVTDGEHSSATMTATVGAGGTWSLTGIDVSALDDGTLTFNITVTDAAGNATLASSSSTKDTVLPVIQISTIADPITIASHKALQLGGTGEPGSTISVVVTDGTNSTAARTATVAGDGTWLISDIDTSSLADGLITFQVTATDTVGNTATGSQSVTKKTVAISAIAAINLNNAENLTVSGTGEVGATISLVASDGTTTSQAYEAVVGDDGTWTIRGINVSALADGTLVFTVTATDSLSNTAQTTRTASKDSSAPELVFVGVTNLIKAADASTVSAHGTGEVGATITLVATDGTNSTVNYTVVVAEDGTWNINDIEVSALADGTITFNATASDVAGNTATDSHTALKDTIAPTVSITLLTTPITADNEASTQVSGTSEAGAAISVTVSDGATTTDAYTTTVAEDGNWSISGIDVSGLLSGAITYTATATDAAGNSTNTSTTGSKETFAITSVTDPINAASVAAVSASGVGVVGATVSITVTDGEHATNAFTATVAANGTWIIDNIDVSALSDGALIFLATASNPGVGTSNTETVAAKDTLAPVVLFDAATETINSVSAAAVTVSGTGDPGGVISVVASDGALSSAIYTATVEEDGTWTINGIDVSTLADGEITFTANISDDAGNTGEDNQVRVKNTVGPELGISGVTTPVDGDTDTNVTIIGTGEPFNSIAVVIRDINGTTVLANTLSADDGSWSISSINVQTLAPGTLTFTVTATNPIGNSTEKVINSTKTSDAVPLGAIDSAFADESDWI